MRILILAKFFLKDGASTHIFTLAEEVAKKNDVYIMSAGAAADKSSKEFFDKNFPKNVEHCEIKFPNYFNYKFFSKIKQFLTYIIVIPKALKKIKEINPDVIHVHYPITSYMAWLANKVYRIPFVTTYHIKGIPNTILHKQANISIAISSEMKEELIERWGYQKESVELVFNGVSENKFTQKIEDEEKNKLKKKLGINSTDIIIGFVGTYQYKKGIDILLKAVAKIKNMNIKLILLGAGEVEWLENIIKEFKIEDKVIFQKFQDPVIYYSIFDIFVLPSRNEGFPLVALESMMMGCCTIRSNVSGAYDMIENKKTGFIFENENIEELTEILINLIKNEDLRKEVALNGKKNVINKFTEKHMVNKTIAVYEKLISEGK